MTKKLCKALKLNKKQCARSVQKDSEYCWQHRISRFGNARWYNNTKIQAIIAAVGTTIAIIAFLFAVYVWKTGPTKENQEVTLAVVKETKENQKATLVELDKIKGIIEQLEPGITDNTKLAIENLFLIILNERDIPSWQWPEKLQEIAERHQELLAKWQTVQSGDPAVDALKANARQMIELGKYDKADLFLQDAIEIDRKAIQAQQEKLEKRKLSMARSLASRGDIAKTKLNYDKAIELYMQALDSVPPAQSAIRATYTNNLGFLYSTTAKYKEAEPLLRRALTMDETSFGPDHPNVGRDLNNLAGLLLATNRLTEAEALYRRSLAISEASFGPNHPKVAIRLNNLAGLLMNTNRLTEAEPLYLQAIAINEALFGPDHPKVAAFLNNLAQLLQAENRLTEAEPLFRRALKIDQALFGPNHPNVAIRLNNLASLLKATNRFAEAEPLLRQALKIYEASFGPNHPNVATTLNNLAGLLMATDRLKEAEPLMRRNLEIFIEFTRRTGHPHPHLKDAINNFSKLLMKMGHSEDEVISRLKSLGLEILPNENDNKND